MLERFCNSKDDPYQELIGIFNDSNNSFINEELNNIIIGVHERNLCAIINHI